MKSKSSHASEESRATLMNSRRLSTVLLLALSLPLAASRRSDAQAENPDAAVGPLPGHSYHGEVFNEGPRQKARLMGGTGQIVFPISTSSEEAQQFFLQGVGQLHGFWYFEAERSFRQAAMLDPGCAMAYWGMAMANLENGERARGFIAEATKRKESASRKEQLWIDAVADYLSDEGQEVDRRRRFVEALEALVREFPDDLEPKAFLALQIWRNSDNGIPLSSRQALESLIQDVLRVEPLHPVHHYRIHNWDGGEAAVALTSAAVCGQAAPNIAHMWHMPGHIYSKLHRYADAAWQQEASARVDHTHMMRDGLLPDQIHNYAHNNEWLIRNLSHIGRVRDAISLAQNLIELPRHPKYNTLTRRGSASAKFGRERLIELLVRWELWDELLDLADTVYLEPTDVRAEQARRLRAIGIAAFQSGDADRGREVIAELVSLSLEQRDRRDSEIDQAEPKVRDENPDLDDESLKPKVQDARDAAKRLAEESTEQIDAALNELRGLERLAADDKPAARDYFHRLSGVSKERQAVYFLLADDRDRAERLARESADESVSQVQPLARYIEILEQCGKPDEAAAAFGRLRDTAAHADLDLPVLVRLRPIAKRLGLPDDWRSKLDPPRDVGDRPDLAHLGPFRWQPSPALTWQLPDAHGNQHSLDDYRGRPVVVIFYLGWGCLHCVEQLQAFAPREEDFRRAGIALVAISNESSELLRQGLANYGQEGHFAFPLLSDESMTVFRKYRAFDDFENRPLHGTFLIDAEGRVRWHDIGHEPFSDVTFLLEEAERLLGLDIPGLASDASVQ